MCIRDSADTDVDMLEINVSCPNVKEGGIALGQKAECLSEITAAVKEKARQPIIMKLSPNAVSYTHLERLSFRICGL